MALRIRRGTEAQRTSVAPFDMGEIVWTTDTERLYVGDGITSGGKNILANSAGNGLVFNAVTQRLDVGNFNITTDDVPEGTQPGRQYHTVERAQAAAASLFTTGAHNGISFTYQDANNRIDATVSLSLDALSDVVITGTPTTGYVLKYDGTKWAPAPDVDTDTDTGILAVVDDLTPELGGNLSLNTKNIVGDGNLNFTGNIDLIGNGTSTGNITAPGSLEVTGTVTATGGLGANLGLNGKSITGVGGIDITGDINIVGDFSTDGLTINLNEITSSVPSPGGDDVFSNNAVSLGNSTIPNTLWIKSDRNFAVLNGVTNGTQNTGFVSRISRGTLAVPTKINPFDPVAYIEGQGHNGTKFVSLGGFGMFADQTWNGTPSGLTGGIPGSFGAVVLTSSGSQQFLEFNSKGVLNVPILKAASYATGALPTSPEEGWMVFDSTTKQFKGWNGTDWIVLG